MGMSFSIFISKILIKLHINKFLFHVLCPFLKTEKGLLSIKDAYKILNKVSENPNNSCICNNRIEEYPEYDLQIIIPAYNAEKYINDCLDSVFKQKTKYKYLVVVVNDGSTDNTSYILNAYKDKKNLKIIHQENKGFSGARNAGLNNINSKYITFLDSDDIILPDAIDNLLDKAYKSNAQIVVGGYRCFNDNKIIKEILFEEKDNISYTMVSGFPWGKIYKSNLFKNIQFPLNYLFEDTLMNLIVFPLCNNISSIDRLTNGYRINQQGITLSVKSKPKNIDSFWVTEQLLKDRTSLQINEKDPDFCRTLLSQIKVNFQRISRINNREVDKAIFVLSRKILYDNIKSFETLIIKSPLRDSFIQNNYKKYRLACLLNL